MQRSVVRAHPALFHAFTFEVKTENGHWSQSRNHARLHGVQAAELSDAEVEAELARPGGVQEVLPLVQAAHPAPGDSVTPTLHGEANASAAPGPARAAAAGPRRGVAAAYSGTADGERRGRLGAAAQTTARGRAPHSRLGALAFRPGSLGRAQEG